MNILKIFGICLWLQIACWGEYEPHLISNGGHLRIDLSWEPQTDSIYEIQRSFPEANNFQPLTDGWQLSSRYSDFVGENGLNYQYRVRAHQIAQGYDAPLSNSPWSKVVLGESHPQNQDDLITDLQRANFEFIWSYAHPDSGLVRESSQSTTNISHALWQQRCVTTGATGMAFFNFAVGVERNWITREQAVVRTLQILQFLNEKTTRYHGAWAHWYDGTTGQPLPFSAYDDGADLVETGFLAQGLIFAREYFNMENPQEEKIRQWTQQMWTDIDWTFFTNQDEQDPYLLWHWSPNYGFKINLPIRGATECHIVHLLALIAPIHKVDFEFYKNNWATPVFHRNRTLESQNLSLGQKYGGPLFFAHYSYLGLDPRLLSYKSKTYFDHYADICKSQYAYEKRARPTNSKYQIWGLTASLDPYGYGVHSPGLLDNGTLTPTASLSSWPYAPDLALESFLGLYEERGKTLWKEFGFVDAFNDRNNWVAAGHLSIDVATIAPMIENHRTGLCWKIFSNAKEVKAMLELINEGQF